MHISVRSKQALQAVRLGQHKSKPGARSLDLESATGIANAVRERHVSAREMVSRSLKRIDELDVEVNSCVEVLADRAMADAERVDRSDQAGSLVGVPITVKEIFDLQGETTTWGCPALRHSPKARRDAPIVARLGGAGAIAVARTNIPELSCWGHTANPIYGETRNPWNETRTVGGSSGGAAASVSLGIAPLALGSDAGGSIRIPASFCGVVGFKPSFQTLPSNPGAAVSRLNCAGPLSATVADAALALSVLAPSVNVGKSRLSGARIGVTEDYGFAPVEGTVRFGFREAIGTLTDNGIAVQKAFPPPVSPLPFVVPILECDVYDAFEQVLKKHDHGLMPETVAVARIGERTTGLDYVRAVAARLEFQAAWSDFFVDTDLLLAPTTQIPPFDLGSFGPASIDAHSIDPTADGAWYPIGFIANVLGAPAISIPCGVDPDGLPLGLQVMGRPGADGLVLSAAAAFEQALAWAPPTLPL